MKLPVAKLFIFKHVMVMALCTKDSFWISNLRCINEHFSYLSWKCLHKHTLTKIFNTEKLSVSIIIVNCISHLKCIHPLILRKTERKWKKRGGGEREKREREGERQRDWINQLLTYWRMIIGELITSWSVWIFKSTF